MADNICLMRADEACARLRSIADAAHSTCLPRFARAEQFRNSVQKLDPFQLRRRDRRHPVLTNGSYTWQMSSPAQLTGKALNCRRIQRSTSRCAGLDFGTTCLSEKLTMLRTAGTQSVSTCRIRVHHLHPSLQRLPKHWTTLDFPGLSTD